MTEKNPFDDIPADIPPLDPMLGGIFGAFDPLSDDEVDSFEASALQGAYKLLRKRYANLSACHDDVLSGRAERHERDAMLSIGVQNALNIALQFMEKREDRYAQDVVAKRAHELQMLQMQHDLIVKLATRQP